MKCKHKLKRNVYRKSVVETSGVRIFIEMGFAGGGICCVDDGNCECIQWSLADSWRRLGESVEISEASEGSRRRSLKFLKISMSHCLFSEEDWRKLSETCCKGERQSLALFLDLKRRNGIFYPQMLICYVGKSELAQILCKLVAR
jgi:hypothetical protein